jgi:hypothetical protein
MCDTITAYGFSNPIVVPGRPPPRFHFWWPMTGPKGVPGASAARKLIASNPKSQTVRQPTRRASDISTNALYTVSKYNRWHDFDLEHALIDQIADDLGSPELGTSTNTSICLFKRLVAEIVVMYVRRTEQLCAAIARSVSRDHGRPRINRLASCASSGWRRVRM